MSTIEHAFRIIKIISQGHSRITTIAERMDEPKSKIHRILSELIIAGVVIKDERRRRYYLGPLLGNLSSDIFALHSRIVSAAKDEMQILRGESGETVALHVMHGYQKCCVEEFLGLNEIPFSASKGSLTQIYAGASGKALLALHEEEDLANILDSISLVKVAPNTICSRDELEKEIKKIRELKYAVSVGERVPHSACVSVPITGHFVPASISVFGPDYRFDESWRQSILPALTRAARSIEERLAS